MGVFNFIIKLIYNLSPSSGLKGSRPIKESPILTEVSYITSLSKSVKGLQLDDFIVTLNGKEKVVTKLEYDTKRELYKLSVNT